MQALTQEFTSTGSKFWNHPEALEGLRNGKPKPIVTHIMPCDACNHTCAFCSVQTREGNTLSQETITGYIEQLLPLGLKAVILSGGGNPILYKEKRPPTAPGMDEVPGWDFNDVVDYLHGSGLEIGVITNGMPLMNYSGPKGWESTHSRMSWKTVRPETLDKCTWIRISMSGLDHKENEVYVPEINPTKTTLGFSYVAHDIYQVPEEPNHGKVSTLEDLVEFSPEAKFIDVAESGRFFEARIPELTKQIGDIVRKHKPEYVRLLPNCLQPGLIDKRCYQLQLMADAIDPTVVFVQHKPPAAPKKCFLGYLHPVLNSDGYVYPCDSCVLNKAAGHKFAAPWRVCAWNEIGELYATSARSLIHDPARLCPGCVFTQSNLLLQGVVEGIPLQSPQLVKHPNFV